MVPLSDGKNLTECKWIYKVKTNFDGSLEQYKAYLVAKGFSQEYGIDYEETFASVEKVSILLSVIGVNYCSISQLDVKNAFLNGYPSEEIRMHPHPSFLSPPVLSATSDVISLWLQTISLGLVFLIPGCGSPDWLSA